MKKKLLFLIAIMTVLACLFAISVSADEVLNEGGALKTSATDEFATGDDINYITGLANEIYFNGTSSQGGKSLSLEQRMVLKNDDGTYSTFPSAYIFNISLDGSKRAQRFQKLDITLINAATGQTYENADIIRFEIPEGITDIHHDDRSATSRFGADYLNASSLKYISFPSSLSTFTMGNFCQNLTSLQEADFSKVTNVWSFATESCFNGCTSLSTVTFPETFDSAENGFNTCKIGGYMFYKCTSLASVSLPSEITEISQRAFQESGLVSIDLTDTNVSSIGANAFRNTTSLQSAILPNTVTSTGTDAFAYSSIVSVKLPQNESYTTINSYMFYECDSLARVDIPDNVTTINNYAFGYCDSLEAVYLSNNLVTLEEHANGAFENCQKMYFVDTFGSNDKPSVYYFPSGLTGTFNGETFKTCKAINDTIVLPTGVTGVRHGWAFGAIGGNKNIVFLGKIETFYYGQDSGNTNFYFANAESKIDNLGITCSSDSGLSNCCVYVCAANKYGKLDKYRSDSEIWLDMTLENHLYATSETIDATCTKNAGTYYYCFCGVETGSDEQEGTMLGHEKGELDSRYFPAIVDGDGSLNYFVDMITEHDCTRCDDTIKGTEPNTALFVADGYSIPEKDDSTCISHTIKVNKTNVANYEALTGDKVDYGVVAGASTSLSSPVVINNGEIEADTYALVGDMTGTEYTKLVIKVTGLEAGDQISCNAYIVFNKDSEKIYYLCGDTVTKTALAKSL